MATPFIAAYKSGATSVSITEDKLIYWYRIAPKALDCDATDTTMGPATNETGDYFNGRPNGFDTLADDIFVVSLLTEPGIVLVNSAGTQYVFDAPAGASAFSVPFVVGSQAFSLQRGGVEVMATTSLKEIKNECNCGIYNFNTYVGTVPEGPRDDMPPEGLASLTVSLNVPTCSPTPSLPATPPATTAVTTTITASPADSATPVRR